MCAKLFEKILVPYDGSKFSKSAVNRAVEVADRLESKIFLFSVINVDYIRPPGSLLGVVTKTSVNTRAKIIASARKKMQSNLQREAARCKKQGRFAEVHISSGNISDEILKFAKKNKITLIIMGRQGLHGIKRLKALGSTSRKVSELSSCPVLLVR
jgi:nucleotide-binding universal stress UspA family protein